MFWTSPLYAGDFPPYKRSPHVGPAILSPSAILPRAQNDQPRQKYPTADLLKRSSISRILDDRVARQPFGSYCFPPISDAQFRTEFGLQLTKCNSPHSLRAFFDGNEGAIK